MRSWGNSLRHEVYSFAHKGTPQPNWKKKRIQLIKRSGLDKNVSEEIEKELLLNTCTFFYRYILTGAFNGICTEKRELKKFFVSCLPSRYIT